MIISLVAAVSDNNAIGKNNQLLWHLPNDLKFFKNTTWAMPVIMGRKTFESVNNQPLNGRTNIVITRQPQKIQAPQGVFVVPDLDKALQQAATTDAKEAFVVGGGEIYKEALPLANKLIITRVHTQIEGDVFFPVFDTAQWQQTYGLDFAADQKHAYPYSFQVWQRK
jgi:dihydrofolate reductase